MLSIPVVFVYTIDKNTLEIYLYNKKIKVYNKKKNNYVTFK